jgi:adenylosuccinate lyase
MIPRYTTPEMAEIWSEQTKFDKMLQVEVQACKALAEKGEIPQQAAVEIEQRAAFDLDKVKETEKVTRHDVAAFVKNVGENIGEAGKYVHFGLTSSDVIDTAINLQLRDALDVVIAAARKLEAVLAEKAVKHKRTPMMGRSHGVHAEPITLGLKLALYVSEMRRNLARLERARDTISVGKISGAVGTFANVDPIVEEKVCEALGLTPAAVSNQVIQRDRYAEMLSALAVCGASLEKFALEIRGLHRTEVKECEEPFRKGQRGSSAMPHKKNPIVCERICGMARLLRGNALAGLENVALWHERDISHSSVERVIFPDSTTLLHYMILKMTDVFANLVVHPENMARNLEMSKGLIFSQRLLLDLIRKGLSRDEAYEIVQRNAMKANEEGLEFKDVVARDQRVLELLGPGELDLCFDISYHLRNVDAIFQRLGL